MINDSLARDGFKSIGFRNLPPLTLGVKICTSLVDFEGLALSLIVRGDAKPDAYLFALCHQPNLAGSLCGSNGMSRIEISSANAGTSHHCNSHSYLVGQDLGHDCPRAT